MADNQDRENTAKEETAEQVSKKIPPNEPVKSIEQEVAKDELTACEETIAEHIATGVPTDATVAGAGLPQPGAHERGEEEDVEGSAER